MKFDENLAALHGYLCADGYVSRNFPHQKHKYYIIGLRNQNYNLLKDFQDRFNAVFCKKPRLVRRERCHINSKEIYYKLMEFGPFHSNNWVFPPMSKTQAAVWLRAFFDCEGWVIARTAQDRRIAAESINYKELLKIKETLEKTFNIPSSMYIKRNRNIAGIHIYGKENLIRFQKEIGLLHPKKNHKLQEAISSFADYNWKFPDNKKDIIKFIANRARVKKPHTIRFSSIYEKNLIQLSNLLLSVYNIKTNRYNRKNGQGRAYFELAIYKEKDVRKLLLTGALTKEQQAKLEL